MFSKEEVDDYLKFRIYFEKIDKNYKSSVPKNRVCDIRKILSLYKRINSKLLNKYDQNRIARLEKIIEFEDSTRMWSWKRYLCDPFD